VNLFSINFPNLFSGLFSGFFFSFGFCLCFGFGFRLGGGAGRWSRLSIRPGFRFRGGSSFSSAGRTRPAAVILWRSACTGPSRTRITVISPGGSGVAAGFGVHRRFGFARLRFNLPDFGGLDGGGVFILDESPVKSVFNPDYPLAFTTGKADELAGFLLMHINQNVTVRAIGSFDIHFDFQMFISPLLLVLYILFYCPEFYQYPLFCSLKQTKIGFQTGRFSMIRILVRLVAGDAVSL
jgi:hypothetical protein